MKRFIIIMLIFTILMGMLILGVGYETKLSQEKWNNGVCTECGGKYRFSGATHLRNGGDYYYYSCEDCDHTIKTNILMK